LPDIVSILASSLIFTNSFIFRRDGNLKYYQALFLICNKYQNHLLGITRGDFNFKFGGRGLISEDGQQDETM